MDLITKPIFQSSNLNEACSGGDLICPDGSYRTGTQDGSCGSDNVCTQLRQSNDPSNACSAFNTGDAIPSFTFPYSSTAFPTTLACVTCTVPFSIYSEYYKLYDNVQLYMNDYCSTIASDGDAPPGSRIQTCFSGADPNNYQKPCFPYPPGSGVVQGSDPIFNGQIMPIFCSQPTETPANCPDDPITKKQMPACSNLISGGSEGDLCRRWYTNNITLGDLAMTKYCGTRANSANIDCSCLNRAANPIYRAAKGSNPVTSIQDACWWIPCQNPEEYLVTSNLEDPTCPSSICVIVNQNIANAGGTINIGEVNQYIDCPGTPSGQSFWDRYKFWIIGGIILVFIIIVIIVIAYTYSR